MKKIFQISLFFMILIPFHTFGQGKVEFQKMKHSFGEIQEEGGAAIVNFEFKNTGNTAIKLTDVKASCGCTTPQWTKEAIEPGKTGVVTASYDPMNRPGPFNKSITVNTDATGQTPVILTIDGNVIARKKGIKDWYPAEDGNLRFSTKNFYFQKVFNDGTATQKITVYNQGEKLVNLKLDETKLTLPKHVTLKANKTALNPKDSANLELTYNAPIKNDWGYVSDPFDLKTDDAGKEIKKMFVSATITENFANMTDPAKMPKVKYDKLKHDFGKINQNTRNAATFTLTNEGGSPLIIRKTKASCGCTASDPKKTTLAPGESTTIEVTYSSGTKSGKQNQTVTVICNDPRQTESKLTVEAEILAPATNTTTTPTTGQK